MDLVPIVSVERIFFAFFWCAHGAEMLSHNVHVDEYTYDDDFSG